MTFLIFNATLMWVSKCRALINVTVVRCQSKKLYHCRIHTLEIKKETDPARKKILCDNLTAHQLDASLVRDFFIGLFKMLENTTMG